MRVIALLAWFDESVPWLAATVGSAATLCDHIIAVDGAYALYPEGRHRSGTEQHSTIQEAAFAVGMGCTIYTPAEKWAGNEVEKRTAMFRLAEAVATPFEDWYLVIDADEVVIGCPPDAKEQLADTELDVAEVKLVNVEDIEKNLETAVAARQFSYPARSAEPLRALFRAIPGLAPCGNHYTNMTPDGRVLIGAGTDKRQEPALDLQGIVFEHRSNFRTVHRDEQRRTYYGKRDAAQVENAVCFICGQGGATKIADTDWHPNADGSLTSIKAPVCESCESEATEKSRYWIRKLGGDPDTWIDHGRIVVPQ